MEQHSTRGTPVPAPEQMTMLDWFAGQALVGVVSAEMATDIDRRLLPRDIAERSYDIAEEMVAIMKKNRPSA